MRVPVLTLAQFRELTRIRLVVEGFAVEEAARIASADQIETVAAARQAFRRRGQGRPDRQRRRASPPTGISTSPLYEAAGMPSLIEMIGRLWLKAGRCSISTCAISRAGSTARSAVQAHAALVAALRRRDPQPPRGAGRGHRAPPPNISKERHGWRNEPAGRL